METHSGESLWNLLLFLGELAGNKACAAQNGETVELDQVTNEILVDSVNLQELIQIAEDFKQRVVLHICAISVVDHTDAEERIHAMRGEDLVKAIHVGVCPDQTVCKIRNNQNQDQTDDQALLAQTAAHLLIQEEGQEGQNKAGQGSDEAGLANEENGSAADERTDQSTDAALGKVLLADLLGGDGYRLLGSGGRSGSGDGAAAGDAEGSARLQLGAAVRTDHRNTSVMNFCLPLHNSQRTAKSQRRSGKKSGSAPGKNNLFLGK